VGVRAGCDGVVVLGMGRSGTSATASMFVRAGFFAGIDAELLPASDANRLGYYENFFTVHLSQWILDQLGGTWFEPPALDRQLAVCEPLQGALHAELDRITVAGSGRPLVIKDPRIGVLLPIWGPTLSQRLHPVLVLRDPIEVALSLRRRDGTALERGLAAWETHLRAVVGWLAGRHCTVAPFVAMLERPALASNVIASAVAELDPGRRDRVRVALGADALCAEYRHERGGEPSLMTRAQRRLWEWLALLPAGRAVIDPPAGLCNGGWQH
jgi:hypothetical protein